MRKSLIPFFIFVIAYLGCDIYPQDEYEEFYVLESYIVANRNISQVRLSTTAPAFDFYSFENTAVSGATVELRLLDVNGSGTDSTFAYSMDTPGIYTPNVPHSVLPSRTYQLFVTIPNGSAVDEVSATAIVPGDFTVVAGVQDTLVYQSSEQLEVTLSASSYPGRQNVYIFNTISENPIIENLTPLYADFFDDDDDLEDFAETSSGLLNEGNFTQNNDGTVTVRYPWLAVAFFGDNRVVATTVDDNIYDYVRSADVQLGGSTLSPGEIQNVLSHVEGGIGLFGAMASDTIPTFIRPQF
ncbi:MAG: DUF4249 family protein [Balneolaceae bacterium]